MRWSPLVRWSALVYFIYSPISKKQQRLYFSVRGIVSVVTRRGPYSTRWPHNSSEFRPIFRDFNNSFNPITYHSHSPAARRSLAIDAPNSKQFGSVRIRNNSLLLYNFAGDINNHDAHHRLTFPADQSSRRQID